MNAEPKSADERVDLMIQLALMEIAEDKWREIENLDVSDVNVSKRHDRRMRKLFANGVPARRLKKNMKNALIAALIALSVLAMLGMAIPPVREAVIRTVFTWYDTHFGVKYDVQEHTFPTYIENEILPAWIPDGWTIAKELSNLACSAHSVSDGLGNEIFMEQYPIQPNNETVWLDNTDVTIQTVFLNGKTEAKLFSYAEGSRILTWVDRYVFILSGSADEGGDSDVLIRIAESMKP
ncbi:MAG: DUF4367 domain-containing protein [Clostridiales bacterium]|nr:DUF4367 domain-containing protein [Clostridiales bacterium]